MRYSAGYNKLLKEFEHIENATTALNIITDYMDSYTEDYTLRKELYRLKLSHKEHKTPVDKLICIYCEKIINAMDE